MFERFTDGARRVVVLAQEESRLLNHHHIGTEHLLLGLLREDGATARTLEHAGVSLAAARSQVEHAQGRDEKAPNGHIPFTPRAKMVMERSLRTSQRLGGTSIGSPHLLRAILDVPESGAHQLLVGFGVDPEALALVADNLAQSDSEAEGDQSASRAGSAGTRSGFLPFATGISAREIEAAIARRGAEMAQAHDRLADGLRRYGRHRDGCDANSDSDSERGCSCGFDRLLAEIAPPETPRQDPASS
ncbi:MAG: hypothetical protein M3Y77_15400 [Actinomycetota bacterium]|nr:hypothetical protein [Actinomycetota bacterium]